METYNYLTFQSSSPEQAKIFADVWIEAMGGEHFYCDKLWEDEQEEIDRFRTQGGTLKLKEFHNGYAFFYYDEYLEGAKAAAEAFPKQPFLLQAWFKNCSCDGEPCCRITYENGMMSVVYLAADCFTEYYCLECAEKYEEANPHSTHDIEEPSIAGYSEPINLLEWFFSGRNAKCPRCGTPVFKEDEITVELDSIVIDQEQYEHFLQQQESDKQQVAELLEGLTVINQSTLHSVSQTITEFIIPEEIKEIGNSAFLNFRNLRKLSIPESVQLIGENAFKGCEKLAEISIPVSLREIGKNAFSGCKALADSMGRVIVNGILFDFFGSSDLSFQTHSGISRIDCFNKLPPIVYREIRKDDSSKAELCSAMPGDVVRFGVFPQNEDFDAEPITWQVMERIDDRILLLAENGLVNMPYMDSDQNPGWKNASIRKWLNSDFYNFAFDKTERKLIQKTNIITSDNIKTTDQVFILSADEIEKYLSQGIDLAGKCTIYSNIQAYDLYKTDSFFTWWTRNAASDKLSGMDAECILTFNPLEGFSFYGACWGDSPAVRPAMWIKV